MEYVEQRIVTSTNSLLVAPIAVRDNYDFVGWNTSPDGRGVSYTNGQVINLKENLKLYAQWRAQ